MKKLFALIVLSLLLFNCDKEEPFSIDQDNRINVRNELSYCGGSAIAVDHDCSTIPELVPDAPWLGNADVSVTWISDGDLLHIYGKDGEGRAEFGRQVLEIEDADRYAMKVNMYISEAIIVPPGEFPPFLTDFSFGASDGQKDLAVWGKLSSGWISILSIPQSFNTYGIDYSTPGNYSFEVDRSPGINTVKLFRNDALLIEMPYSDLVDIPAGRETNFFGFSGVGSNTVWDFVSYEVCTDPVENLVNKVNILLDGQDAYVLLMKLQDVIGFIEDCKINAAIGKLNSFINQVNAFINNGKLSAEEGSELIAIAEAFIDQLENEGCPG